MCATTAGPFSIWITGASSGIGKAMLASAPEAASRLIGVARREPQEFEDRSERLGWLQADLSSPDGWAALGDSFDAELSAAPGGVAILVHAAATAAPLVNASHADPQEYERAVLLNYAAPAVVGQRFLRAARRTKTDAVVLQLSTGTTTGAYAGWSIYRPGKAAINEWVVTVGLEEPIEPDEPAARVYAIAPGAIDTPMQGVVREADPEGFPRVDKFRSLADSGALRPPDDVAVQLWAAIDGGLEPGAFVDLREL